MAIKKSFRDYVDITWQNQSQKDKQFAVMNCWNAVGNIMQGSNISPSKAIEYAEQLLISTYIFENLARPQMKIIQDVEAEKFNQEAEIIKEDKKIKQPF
jgi:hypothetical protein